LINRGISISEPELFNSYQNAQDVTMLDYFISMYDKEICVKNFEGILQYRGPKNSVNGRFMLNSINNHAVTFVLSCGTGKLIAVFMAINALKKWRCQKNLF